MESIILAKNYEKDRLKSNERNEIENLSVFPKTIIFFKPQESVYDYSFYFSSSCRP
jgi:hypothetical protein